MKSISGTSAGPDRIRGEPARRQVCERGVLQALEQFVGGSARTSVARRPNETVLAANDQ